MRSHYAREIIQNPYKVSPFQQRSRLKSLKQLRQIPFQDVSGQSKAVQQHILQLLQKKLVDENSKQQTQQNTANPSSKNYTKLSSKHSIKQNSQKQLKNLKESNKLFQYFQDLYTRQVPAEKVERQKVNFCEKEFQQIRNKVLSKLELNKLRLHQLQRKMNKKYLQLHEYHQDLKSLGSELKQQRKTLILDEKLRKGKSQNKSTSLNSAKDNHSNILLKPPSLKERHYLIQDTIRNLKQQISSVQDQIQTVHVKDSQIKDEWITFLKLFLNNGYYLNNGSDNVLEELRRLNHKLTLNDLLTQILDQNAKKYLLAYYQDFDSKSNNPKERNQPLSKSKNYQRNKIHSNIQMTSLINSSNLKLIYSHTKDVMTNMLKRSSFRSSPQPPKKQQTILPKIKPSKRTSKVKHTKNEQDQAYADIQKVIGDQTSLEDSKRIQIQRINHIYKNNGEEMQKKGKLMKRIMFGFSAK